jgi:hypothetical protein
MDGSFLSSMKTLTYISSGLSFLYFWLAFISIKYIRTETLGLDDDGNVVKIKFHLI